MECGETFINHWNVLLLPKWMYHGELVDLYRDIERFDKGTSNDPFHKRTSSEPFHIEGAGNTLFSEDHEMLGMLHNLQGLIEQDEETAEEASIENDMSFNNGVEEETTNIFQKLLNQAHRQLYLNHLEFSSLNYLVTLMHVKEFVDLAHCPTCGEFRYKSNPIRGKTISHKDKRVEIDDVLRHPADA
ncbi:uncharacterized protein E5676_scaffold275G00400 [Cucumis melo var. makuwa]|uniref:Uncharacterized protein n=1 Tax=Cucumis melo var. makuwa TaxID=1194695 RepID=A0A5D3DDF0_CUCMM|nr:uncharacterized protein E6C27_scaffold386G00780 [Cucumis melo var. makuwa]TYK21548.1 uncharacterized protein E5676_scaffold275G00400 [Cucumis melo var. makuwa]